MRGSVLPPSIAGELGALKRRVTDLERRLRPASPSRIAAKGLRFATVVIAAKDTNLHGQAVDVQCGGFNDDQTIQNAIDTYLGSGGGKVLLLEGTYNITGTIEAEHVTIEGMGPATIISSTVGGDYSTDPPIILEADSCLRNCSLVITGAERGKSIVALLGYSKVEECDFTDCGARGDTVAGTATACVYRHNRFTGFVLDFAISVGFVENGHVVEGNRFHDLHGPAWVDGFAYGIYAPATQGTIRGNTFSNCVFQTAIFAIGATVEANEFDAACNFWFSAIEAESCAVDGNVIADTIIGIDVTDDPDIASNWGPKGFAGTGMSLSGCAGAGNNVTVTPKDPTYNLVSACDVSGSDNAIAGNSLTGYDYGLVFYSTVGSAATGNVCGGATYDLWFDPGVVGCAATGNVGNNSHAFQDDGTGDSFVGNL